MTDRKAAMRHFEAVRSHVGAIHKLRQNEPYIISFDLELADGRHQGIYLAELEDSDGQRFLRLSTPIGPLSGVDARRRPAKPERSRSRGSAAGRGSRMRRAPPSRS